MKKNYIMLVLATMFATATFAQTVVLWGGKGTKDGEFDGGLNNWTTKGVESDDPSKSANAVWEWDAKGAATKGAYSSTQTINSPSKANGAAVFNSDYLDNGGVENAFGLGPAPGPQIGELISPIIDLSNEPNVAITFSQSFRNFDAQTYLVYSKDGGVTWADTIRIVANELVKTNAAATNILPRVSLPGAGGTKQFRFKFVFDGNYYAWIIDDVAVIRGEDYNLRTNRSFYAIPENFNTPLSQVRAIQFLNDIENLGGKAQKAVQTVTISKAGTTFHKDSIVHATILPGKTIENKLFKSFKPTEKGNYAGSYTVKGTNPEFDNTDNSLPFTFTVSDSTFAKEKQRTGEVTPFNAIDPAGSDKSLAFGNIFYVEKGIGYKSGTAEFGFTNGSEVKGQTATLTIREWEDENGDSTINSMDELKTIAGLLDYTFTGKEVAPVAGNPSAKLTKVYIPNDANGKLPLKLKDNTFYAIMFEYDGDGLAAGTKTPKLATSDEFNFRAGYFAQREAGFAHPQTSTILKVGADFFRIAYGEDATPMIRWNVVPIPSDVEDIKLAETAVKVGPNPSTDYINVAFNFENTMKTVELSVTDAAGRTVLTTKYKDIQTDNVNLDLNKLSNGAYQMYIKTEAGVSVKPFVVQK
jgi:hypothetical protein